MRHPRLILTALLFIATASAASAQGTQISLGSLQHDTSLPVEVSADNLTVQNETGSAVFEGSVVVVQGEMRLAADKIEVDYNPATDTGGSNIRQMLASGGVTFANGSDAAESQSAVYTPDDGLLLMTGDVLLTQGPSAISGDRLTVNLDAGTGKMEGRVRTVFQPSGN